ncbi:hypothetical protein [Paenibacillus elgii]|uniref:hypothetical protein n=1 Tax=Paenibacillus elgii TaxID=189691 RepID=UPI0013CFC099|nr:hypothetical protein [Paenibacillus elgii]
MLKTEQLEEQIMKVLDANCGQTPFPSGQIRFLCLLPAFPGGNALLKDATLLFPVKPIQ